VSVVREAGRAAEVVRLHSAVDGWGVVVVVVVVVVVRMAGWVMVVVMAVAARVKSRPR
jgi:hypothetical protein